MASKARMCPSSQLLMDMSAYPPAHIQPDLGRQMTSTYTLALLPMTRSVSQATSPAQST
jgi:hypothetical protein